MVLAASGSTWPNHNGVLPTGASTSSSRAASVSQCSFSYTPPTGFTGTDSFTYTVTTAAGDTETATVNVTEW